VDDVCGRDAEPPVAIIPDDVVFRPFEVVGLLFFIFETNSTVFMIIYSKLIFK